LGPEKPSDDFPHGEESDLLHHQNLQPPGTTTMHSPRSGTYSTGATDVVQTPARHPFDDKIDELLPQTGGSRSAAMTQARLLYPALYQSYVNGGTAQQQQTQRGKTSDQLGKLGQPETWPQSDHPIRPDPKSQRRRVRRHDQQVKKSFESAVADEMARGCTTYEVAAQRVVNAYGTTLPHEFVRKGVDVEMSFLEKADEYIDADSTMPRTEALRAARLDPANKRLFKMLQSVR